MRCKVYSPPPSYKWIIVEWLGGSGFHSGEFQSFLDVPWLSYPFRWNYPCSENNPGLTWIRVKNEEWDQVKGELVPRHFPRESIILSTKMTLAPRPEPTLGEFPKCHAYWITASVICLLLCVVWFGPSSLILCKVPQHNLNPAVVRELYGGLPHLATGLE